MFIYIDWDIGICFFWEVGENVECIEILNFCLNNIVFGDYIGVIYCILWLFLKDIIKIVFYCVDVGGYGFI